MSVNKIINSVEKKWSILFEQFVCHKVEKFGCFKNNAGILHVNSTNSGIYLKGKRK